VTAYLDLSQPYFSGLPQGSVTSPYRLTTRTNVQLPSTALPPPCAAQVSELALPAHCGTHVDAPNHFLPGAAGIDEIPLATLIGPAILADVRCERLQAIGVADLELAGAQPRPGEMLLIRTGWGTFWSSDQRERYFDDHPYLAAEVADWLLERGISVLLMDVSSPDIAAAVRPPAYSFPIHTSLLPRGVLIAENLNLEPLAGMGGARLNVFAAPLAIRGSDGSPARIVAWR
jgi:kynurenine formamidase